MFKLKNLFDILTDFSPINIFNVNETNLFFKRLPDKTLMFKSIERSGGKCGKECITIMLEANVSGIEKVKLLIIGKEMKPKCFKENKSLPDDYRSNKKASMISSLFSE